MSIISIALCTYNGETYLQEQLNSYLRQSRLPDELIVCDDRSTDGTVGILKRFRESAPFSVKLFENESNLGTVKNFEKAVANCTGDFIFLSDQDDVWHSEKIRIFEEEFGKDPEIGLVFCDADFVDSNLEFLGESLFDLLEFKGERRKVFESGGDFSLFLELVFAIGCASAFRSNFRPVMLPLPVDIPGVIHDYWIDLVLSAISKIQVVDRVLLQYRQHDDQQTGHRHLLGFERGVRPGLSDRIASSHDFAGSASRFFTMKYRAEKVRQRVAENSQFSTVKVDREIQILDEQLRHLTQRDRIKNTKSRREKISIIASELFSFRYHRFSSGSRSAVKDLLQRKTTKYS